MKFQENLRLNGPVARNDRKCVKDWDGGEQFGGLKIPAGMKIRFPLHTIHHNPEFWPEPDLYKPERFLKENFTLRKRRELHHGDVETFICRFSRKVGYTIYDILKMFQRNQSCISVRHS